MPEPVGYKRLRRDWQTFRLYQNWSEVRTARSAGGAPESWKVRGGPAIHTALDPTTLLKEIWIRRVYTPPCCDLRPGDRVIDIGANIGVFSLFAVRRGARRVLAYEANSETFPYLERNLRENGASQASGFWQAVSDRPGTVRLFMPPVACQGGRTVQTGEAPHDRSEEVPAVTLESIMNEHHLDQVEFLKIDCEGAEGLILPATPAACLRRVQRVAMEFHDGESPLSHSELEALLRGVGFTTQLSWNGRGRFGYLYGWR
jgi:FkbM family methyltransferase